MGDSCIDADRAAGLVPPKLWGWQSRDYQEREVKRLLALGNPDPWVLEWAAYLNITLPQTTDNHEAMCDAT